MKARGAWHTAASILVLILGAAAADPASGQTADPPAPGASWTVLDAIGYAGLGFGAGLVAAWDLDGNDFGPPPLALGIILGSTVTGMASGAVLGHLARRSVTDGRPLSTGHRAAALAGVAMAGGALGALAAVPLINPSGEGTFLGTDERTILLTTGAGLALGSLYAWRVRDQLRSRSVRFTPEVRGDRIGLRIEMTLAP